MCNHAGSHGAPAAKKAPPSLPESPLLLVSVRSGREACEALAGGAQIIDVKEPSAGPLGRASLEVCESVVFEARRPGAGAVLTAALGELDPSEDPGALTLLPDVAFYKLGLAGWGLQGGWGKKLDAWRDVLRGGGSELIAVACADWAEARAPAPEEVFEYAADRGLPAVLIDTYFKNGRSLRSFFSDGALESWIDRLHRAGLRAALAGSLQLQDIEPLLELEADVIAVRGLACTGGARTAGVDAARVSILSALIAKRTCRRA